LQSNIASQELSSETSVNEHILGVVYLFIIVVYNTCTVVVTDYKGVGYREWLTRLLVLLEGVCC